MLQGLDEAEQQLQKERTDFDSLEMSPLRLEANQTQRDDSDEGEECGEEERLFHIRQDCRMVFILQEALYKCEQVITLLAERWAVMSVFISGAMKNFVKTLG